MNRVETRFGYVVTSDNITFEPDPDCRPMGVMCDFCQERLIEYTAGQTYEPYEFGNE